MLHLCHHTPRTLVTLKDIRNIINTKVLTGLDWYDVVIGGRVVGQRLSTKRMHEKVR